MNRTGALLVCLSLVTSVASATTVHSPPSFPSNIQQVHATESGAYLLTGDNQIWFVEPTGAARQIPIPLEHRIEHIDYEAAGALLWGCTRNEVFATNAGGAWQSWRLAEDPARQNCFVAPSAGTAWVLANTASHEGVFVDVGLVEGDELQVETKRRKGAHFRPVATDEAGGFWSTPLYPHTGLAHFDGASWRIWSPNRQTFNGTDFVDVFAFDGPVHPQVLASDGTGGVVAANPTEFVFMRSSAPYPNVERTTVPQPGFGLPGHALAVGAGRIWGIGLADDEMILATWDLSGRLVGAEQIPAPKWFDHRAIAGGFAVAANPHGLWLSKGGVLFHRHPDGWAVFAGQATIDRVRRQRRRQNHGFWSALPLVVAGTLSSALAPALWGPPLDVKYARAGVETLGAMAFGTIPTYVAIQNDVWRGDVRTPVMLAFTLIFSTGIATVATLAPEAVLRSDGEPFQVGGALIGGAIGFGAGALTDLLLDAMGAESAFGRALLWSSFTAIGAPLGFHAMRGPVSAD